MKRKLSISSNVIAAIALGCWVLSLPLTGLVLYSGQRKLPGYEILAMGWLSPIVLNFAWFANVFFLFAITRLFRGDVPLFSSAFAAILAFDIFRFHEFMLNEGGGSTPVYGYGWGAVLWVVSIFLLLVATGTKRPNSKYSDAEVQEEPDRFLPVGVILLGATAVFSASLALNDRREANTAEAQRLQGIAFKRNKVCGVEEPQPQIVLPLVGPLELVSDAIAYPFNSPITLLTWGIPTIRAKGLDYFVVKGEHFDAIGAKASMGPAAARLRASYKSRPDHLGSIYQTILTSTDGTITSFDQTWSPEPHGARYCPERSSFPNSSEQPRKLLMSALGITAPTSVRLEAVEDQSVEQENSILMESRIVAHFSSPTRTKENSGCPPDTGYRGFRLEKYPDTWDLGVPFISNNTYFFAGKNKFSNAICVEGSVYVYSTRKRGSEFTLVIQKRSLTTFAEEWTAKIRMAGNDQALEVGRTKISALKESGRMVSIVLLHDTNNSGVSVEAALRK